MSTPTEDHETSGAASGPAGIRRIHTRDLGDHLMNVAKWHAQRAIRLKNSTKLTDLLDSASSAGASIELLSKSVLARINPTLVVDGGDLTGLLHTVGRSDLTEKSASSMKSRTAYDCLATIKKYTLHSHGIQIATQWP